MKKLGVFLLLLFILPISIAVLDDGDHRAIEAIVRREVQNSNNQMKQELSGDIEAIKSDVDSTLERIDNSATTTKFIIILTLAGTIILAETGISFLRFLTERKKRNLPMKLDQEIRKRKVDITDQRKIIHENNLKVKAQYKELDQLSKQVRKGTRFNRKTNKILKLEQELKRLKSGNA